MRNVLEIKIYAKLNFFVSFYESLLAKFKNMANAYFNCFDYINNIHICYHSVYVRIKKSTSNQKRFNYFRRK